MIQATEQFQGAGWSVARFECDGSGHGWSSEEEIAEHTLVLVRSGFFRRRIDGVETSANPLVAYLERPMEVQRVEHPAGGDVCTGIGIPAAAVDDLAGHGAGRGLALRVDAAADLEHRLLLRLLAINGDGEDILERGMSLVARLLGRESAASRTRRDSRELKLAECVEEAIRNDPGIGLEELALALAVPAYQVSRIFRAVTGQTVGQFRLTVRASVVLARLDGGETDLAGLALEAGFADQSHMTRVLRARTQMTPGRLRNLLGSDRASEGD